MKTNIHRFCHAITWLLLCFPFLLSAQDRPYGKTFATRSEVMAQHGYAVRASL